MPTCSFCNVDDDRRTYVQGGNAFICNECVKVIHDMVITKGIRTQKDLQQADDKKKPSSKAVKGFAADRFYFIGVAKVQDVFGTAVQGISNQPLYVFENTESGHAIGVYGDKNLKSAEVISSPGSSVPDVISSWIELVGRDDFNYVTSYEEGDTFVFELIQAAKDQDGSDFESEFEKDVHILSNDELTSEETLSEHLGKVGFLVQSRADLEINFDEKARKLAIGGDAYKDIGTAVNEVLMENSDIQAVSLIEGSDNAEVWGGSQGRSDGSSYVSIIRVGLLNKNSIEENSVSELSFYNDGDESIFRSIADSNLCFPVDIVVARGAQGNAFNLDVFDKNGEKVIEEAYCTDDEESFQQYFADTVGPILGMGRDIAENVLYALNQLVFAKDLGELDITAEIEEAFENKCKFQVGQGDVISVNAVELKDGVLVEIYPPVSMDWNLEDGNRIEFDSDVHIDGRNEQHRFIGLFHSSAGEMTEDNEGA